MNDYMNLIQQCSASHTTQMTIYSKCCVLSHRYYVIFQGKLNSCYVFVLGGQIKVHLSITNLRKAKFDINNVLGNKDK